MTYGLQVLFTVLFGAAFYVTGGAQSVLQSLLFIGGGVLATALLYFDEAFFSKKYAEQGVENQVIMTRSLLFVAALIPLGIFVTTSSGSSLGMGLVILLLTGIIIEMIQVRSAIDVFNLRFVSQLKEPWGQSSLYKYLGLLVFFWLFLLFKVFIV